jgi:hypothetical protein
MVCHRMRVFVLAGAFIAASVSAASPAMASSFNGYWVLTAQTTNGHCGHSNFDVTISRGRVHYGGGVLMGFPVSLTGDVASSGRTRLNLTAGPRTATGTGTLGRVQGSGTWAGQGPSGTCSGVWSATRVEAHTAPVPATYAPAPAPPPVTPQMPMPYYQPFGTSGQ